MSFMRSRLAISSLNRCIIVDLADGCNVYVVESTENIAHKLR